MTLPVRMAVTKMITWIEIEKRRQKWDVLFQKSLKKFFTQQANTLGSLRQNDYEKYRTQCKAQIDQDEFKLVRLFKDNYLLIAEDFGKYTYGELGKKAFSSFLGGLINWAISTAKKKVLGINTFSKKKIDKIIDKAIKEGKTMQQTKDMLKKEFKTMSDYRAMLIARTEVNAASNRGSLEGARQSKISDLKKEWLATLDSRTRPTHRSANGQIVALEESFTVGGNKMQYPGDPNGGSKETIRCRCTLAYL